MVAKQEASSEKNALCSLGVENPENQYEWKIKTWTISGWCCGFGGRKSFLFHICFFSRWPVVGLRRALTCTSHCASGGVFFKVIPVSLFCVRLAFILSTTALPQISSPRGSRPQGLPQHRPAAGRSRRRAAAVQVKRSKTLLSCTNSCVGFFLFLARNSWQGTLLCQQWDC